MNDFMADLNKLPPSAVLALRARGLGYRVGAKVTCSAADKYDLIKLGYVDQDGGLTRKGLDASCRMRS